MKFFFDECLDPALVKVANNEDYEATCSRDKACCAGRTGILPPTSWSTTGC